MPKKIKVDTDIPANLDIESIAQKMEEQPDMPEMEEQPSQKKPSSKGTSKDYAPNEKVLERLNAMPKAEIKAETGIDIDYLIKNTRKYGVLEAIAYGRFTPTPVMMMPKGSHQKGAKIEPKYATVRINVFTDKTTGEQKWNWEPHPVNLVPKFDKEGQPVMDADGKQQMTYERKKLQPGEIVTIETYNALGKKNGRMELSKEQSDRLRLTGNLGSPIVTYDRDMNPVQTVYSVDPYDNHYLVGVSVDALRKRLEKEQVFKYADKEKVVHEILLDDRDRKALAVGAHIWKEDGGKNIGIQYNTFTGRLERCNSYENALRNEVSKKQEASNAKSLEQSRQQNVAEGKSVGTHL